MTRKVGIPTPRPQPRAILSDVERPEGFDSGVAAAVLVAVAGVPVLD